MRASTTIERRVDGHRKIESNRVDKWPVPTYLQGMNTTNATAETWTQRNLAREIDCASKLGTSAAYRDAATTARDAAVEAPYLTAGAFWDLAAELYATAERLAAEGK